MVAKQLYIIAYDIASNKRRRNVAKILGEYGLRMNKSVFECFIVPDTFKKLQESLSLIVDKKKDSEHQFTYIEAYPKTGRTHQIRVHFSHLGCPVLGDLTYNSLERTINRVPPNLNRKVKLLLTNKLKRQALHSYKLEFMHPLLDKEICVESPIPDDFKYTLDFINQNFMLQ